MIIIANGGKSGIEDYLKDGVKQGREHSRDELDERILLNGDMDALSDAIIRCEKFDSDGQRYLHFTLSFKEDSISQETLEAVSEEFRDFLFSAYEPDEYTAYSEAHIPKIKTLVDKRTGELVERKPHIHFIVPQINAITGRRLEPLGLIKNHIDYIDAFQESLNQKYGFASPKDNLRTTFDNNSQMVSRIKGDLFQGSKVSVTLKQQAFDVALTQPSASLIEYGQKLKAEGFDVRVRNAKSENPYLNIRPQASNQKGINLKEPVFRQDFLMKSIEDKTASLSQHDPTQYIDQAGRSSVSAKYQKKLTHWHEQRALEVRFVTRRNRAHYKTLPFPEKRAFLQQKQRENHERLEQYRQRLSRVGSTRESYGVERGLAAIDRAIGKSATHYANIERHRGELESGIRKYRDRRHIRTLSAHLQQHRRNQGDLILDRKPRRIPQLSPITQYTNDNLDEIGEPDLKQVKQKLEASTLLKSLSQSHGIVIEKYPISKTRLGDRIQCGQRHYNVSDFLTKELNIPWEDARLYLMEEWQQQKGLQIRPVLNPDWQHQLQQEHQRRNTIQQTFKQRINQVYQTKTLSHLERQSQISIEQMRKVLNEMKLTKDVLQERKQLVEKQQMENTPVSKTISGKLLSYGNITKENGQDVFQITLEEHNGNTRQVVTNALKPHIEKGINNKAFTLNEKIFITANINKEKNKVLSYHVHSLKDLSMEQSVNKPINHRLVKETAEQNIKPSLNNDGLLKARSMLKADKKGELVQTQIKDFNEKVKGIHLFDAIPELKERKATINHSPNGDKIVIDGKAMALSTAIKETKNISSQKDIRDILEQTYNKQIKFEFNQKMIHDKHEHETTQRVQDFLNNPEKRSLSQLYGDNNRVGYEQNRLNETTNNVIEPKKKEQHVYPPLEKDIKVKGMNIHYDRDPKTQYVTYSDRINNGKEKLFVDKGESIKMLNKSDNALEVALLLAKEKYGQTLDIRGSVEYKEKMVNIVATRKIDIQFNDPEMSQKLIEAKQQLSLGENTIRAASTPTPPEKGIEQQTQQVQKNIKI